MTDAVRIYVTDEDHEVLANLAEKHAGFQGELLERELARAEVVSGDEIPEDVVTLHSRARVVDETAAIEREITVVPPGEAGGAADAKVSVLSPVGAAIIGLSEGQVIEWPTPSGRARRFRVKSVLYQPEAARRREAESALEAFDRVDQASLESFPASDAPGWRL